MPYVPVLVRMVELVVQSDATFGVALDQAARECGHTLPLPREIEAALLTVAFRMVAGGGIPGAAEA